MQFVILTGMSGAGKSTALKMMEDMGYFCVDNLPIPLFEKICQFFNESSGPKKMAFGIDIRSGEDLSEIEGMLERIKSMNCSYSILFLDCSDEVLVKRFKETRRQHPLSCGERLDKGIERERERLKFLRQEADYTIDTSRLLVRELKLEIEKIFLKNQKYTNLYITILSFGFKYGLPTDSDLVFDVRFLPNPYYVEELRAKTGLDAPVSEFVMNHIEAHTFVDKLEDMVKFLIPNYIIEGKTHLVVSIGCTGGKHRSVTLASELYARLKKQKDIGVKVEHRDIGKDNVIKSAELSM
ncbi:nucleotide-binding protein [Clostridia bacterium]|nr:nucleotide-binding protein [Clostridia bacterium]